MLSGVALGCGLECFVGGCCSAGLEVHKKKSSELPTFGGECIGRPHRPCPQRPIGVFRSRRSYLRKSTWHRIRISKPPLRVSHRKHQTPATPKMQLLTLPHALLALLLATTVSAQFQGFFEQMFGGQQGGHGGHGHHHQQQQNMPSDSKWFRQNYEAGMWTISTSMSEGRRLTDGYSGVRQVFVSWHDGMCAFSTPLPLRVSGSGRQGRVGGGQYDLCEQRGV